VCFFGLQVQEYGSDCPGPNKRRVNIAYLDSVHFFQPRQYRTEVYHEILMAYLDYSRIQGFTHAHIWVSPPKNAQHDYIFYCHPVEQKVITPVRLKTWYTKMLKSAVTAKIVLDFKVGYRIWRIDILYLPMCLHVVYLFRLSSLLAWIVVSLVSMSNYWSSVSSWDLHELLMVHHVPNTEPVYVFNLISTKLNIFVRSVSHIPTSVLLFFVDYV